MDLDLDALEKEINGMEEDVPPQSNVNNQSSQSSH